MRVSAKTDYGVRALIELAHHSGQGPLQACEIAQRQRIPEPYLDQLLTTLRRAGIVRSQRGPQGGHNLARDAAEIRLTEVVEALEGTISPISCLDEGSECSLGGGCAQREVWERVRRATYEILENVTIAQLAARERELTGAARYVI